MDTARLEIFADDLDSSPRLSRSIPAALDGLIDYKVFQEFADELDILLEMLDTDVRRLQNRSWRIVYGQLCITFGSLFWLPYYINLYIVWFFISVIYMASTWLYATYSLRGPKTTGEIIEEIRSICEVVTNRTPNVSFHPIFRGLSAGSQEMEIVTNIDVSISNNAFSALIAADDAVRIGANNNVNIQIPEISY